VYEGDLGSIKAGITLPDTAALHNRNTIQHNSFIDTNLIHNFFLYKLHKIKLLYMFRASSAHLQEVNDVNP